MLAMSVGMQEAQLKYNKKKTHTLTQMSKKQVSVHLRSFVMV